MLNGYSSAAFQGHVLVLNLDLNLVKLRKQQIELAFQLNIYF